MIILNKFKNDNTKTNFRNKYVRPGLTDTEHKAGCFSCQVGVCHIVLTFTSAFPEIDSISRLQADMIAGTTSHMAAYMTAYTISCQDYLSEITGKICY